MIEMRGDPLRKVLESFSLESLQKPVDLADLAKSWGVTSIEMRAIDSDAMLLPESDGYKIVLKPVSEHFSATRQRFSFAHELGHLLLQLSGFQKQSNLATKHRAFNRHNQEEKLCDQIAAEILMPRRVFEVDAQRKRWSLMGLRAMSSVYSTSITATARRMIDLTPETCLLAVWKPSSISGGVPKLQWPYGGGYRYGVPGSALPRRRLWLVTRALNARDVQTGIAPLVDMRRSTSAPPDVPAEALAWGQGEGRQAMVYYYPLRELSEDMVALAKATWRIY